MTPKEKAEELVKKFIELTRFWDEDSGWVDDIISAKQCALIAVDEILSIGWNLPHYENKSGEQYWQKVKQEIGKP